MKKLLLVALIILISSPVWGANTRPTTPTGEEYCFVEASVDTDPGASGYGTVGVNPWAVTKDGKIVFYIESITGATVHLQWKKLDDTTWTDEDSFTSTVTRIIEEKRTGFEWRGVVKDNNQGTSSVFGIGWKCNY